LRDRADRLPLQSFITFMDALKLRLRAKDQLHPILQDLVTGYARFKGSKDWEGRSRMVSWYYFRVVTVFVSQWTSRLITLNAMKASEEITEEQSRQVRFHHVNVFPILISFSYSSTSTTPTRSSSGV
jgi:hypothetical protein